MDNQTAKVYIDIHTYKNICFTLSDLKETVRKLEELLEKAKVQKAEAEGKI